MMDDWVKGAGLGLRRGLIPALQREPEAAIDFFELAPENWLNVGGKLKRSLEYFADRYPIVLHGLSLSLGAPAPLDEKLVKDIGAFMQQYKVRYYTEHLSYCGDDAHLYDLMPIPFTEEAVHYVAARIRRTQDILGQRIAVENVSYYAPSATELTEAAFIQAVLSEADCDLLLDVNNIIVNSINHRYDAEEFLESMPVERVRYFHVAGHYVEAPDLRVDTHGDAVSDPVWDLLDKAYARFGPVPTLLERDFNFPPLQELVAELTQIRTAQAAFADSANLETAHV
ncbi:MAG: DUF692 domain-containing protein [Pseudomonadota bacterium]